MSFYCKAPLRGVPLRGFITHLLLLLLLLLSFYVVAFIVGAHVFEVDVFVVMISQLKVSRSDPCCLFIYAKLIVITVTINKTEESETADITWTLAIVVTFLHSQEFQCLHKFGI